MIAILLLTLQYILQGLLISLFMIAPAFIVIYVFDLINAMILGPIAGALVYKDAKALFARAPFAFLRMVVFGNAEMLYGALCVLKEKIASLDRKPLSIDSGMIDAIPAENTLDPIVFRLKMAKGKGVDPELAKMIKQYFAMKITEKDAELYKGCAQEVFTREDMKTYVNGFTRIEPFHVTALASVNAEHAIEVLDELLQDENLSEQLARKHIASRTCTKSTLYFINEMIYYVYGYEVGQMLTPHMLGTCYAILKPMFDKEMSAAIAREQQVQQLNLDMLQQLSHVEFHMTHIFLGLSREDQMKMILERHKLEYSEVMVQIDTLLQETKDLVESNNLREDNLGEKPLPVLPPIG